MNLIEEMIEWLVQTIPQPSWAEVERSLGKEWFAVCNLADCRDGWFVAEFIHSVEPYEYYLDNEDNLYIHLSCLERMGRLDLAVHYSEVV